VSLCTAEEPVVRGEGAGSAETRPKLIGVETVRADGRPTVFSTGSNSSRQITTACTPNEVKVVQLRRARWAQEVSSMLSVKMVSSNIVSSNIGILQREICLLLWTPRRHAQAMLEQKNRALE
jgi:hypothetical protein